MNTYAYVGGNPVMFVDPLGNAKDPIIRPDIWGHGKLPDGTPKDPHVDYVDNKGKVRIRTPEDINNPKNNIPRRHRQNVLEVLEKMLERLNRLNPILICPYFICGPRFIPRYYEPQMVLLENSRPYCLIL